MEESWNTLGFCKCTFNHLKECHLAKSSYQCLQVALKAIRLHHSHNWCELAPLLAVWAERCRLSEYWGLNYSQIHNDFVQYGWSVLGVTLLMVTAGPYTVACTERDSGMSCPPCFFYAKHLALVWSRAVTNISCKHLHYAQGKHTLSKQQQTRGVHFYTHHVVELPAARCHRAKSTWRQRLEHIRGELVYSELAVRCDDLGVNGGHPAMQSWKLMDVMEEDCSVLCQCHSRMYLYTFNIHHRLQLETGYWTTWILINLLVDFLPPYFIRLTHPENNVGLWQ